MPTIETDFVPRDIFDIHVKNMRERADSDERLTDARIAALEKLMLERFDRIQAIVEGNTAKTDGRIDVLSERIERNIAEHKAIANEMKAEINDIRGDVKALDIKLNNVVDTLTVAINSTNARIDDMQDRQSRNLTKWGVIITFAIGTIQAIIALVPYFSK